MKKINKVLVRLEYNDENKEVEIDVEYLYNRIKILEDTIRETIDLLDENFICYQGNNEYIVKNIQDIFYKLRGVIDL